MLEKLMNCTTVDDMTTLGIWLMDPSRMSTLRSEIAEKNYVFEIADYWPEDKLNLYTVDELIALCREEVDSMNTLHSLQLLQRCCPAVSVTVSKLLQKITR